ncbi:ABC transporter ATP-binding protein [Crassaminicella profunda]|uniref:ABC transporter ATP-binding protein n=1 Tax=Crassaminicella profunda TaxID=1286698 RepID=UPI001CA6DA48|nr:sn-glycerol-3-phosphate ABC transporter ATP-binding protein UgpC [Crassaminicella profunda]QZY54120.1 sn-glycerol-3-phosphate ABC transporter ATP-binding protein UgpC [Crassaminicella profunda]
MAALLLKNIEKIYENGFHAVKNLNLEIEDKEFVVFVGPSGCGKSTTLRMIAGLEEISNGELCIGEKQVNHMEPKDRDIAMVFQNYALYPHMTVFDNMAFGLKLRKAPKKDINEKVVNAAKTLGIEDLLKRKPKQLSGGQRQRVALGRAIVREAQVFLMDEPLSNLDAKLRVQMRTEICKLHKQLNTTFIYVTHDQTEAMTMGTKIVIMKDGIVQQVDTPKRIYEEPKNLFVAGFIGSPQMNFIPVTIIEENGQVLIQLKELAFFLENEKGKELRKNGYIGKNMILGIRPEHIYFEKEKGMIPINGKVELIEYIGSETYVYIETTNGNIIGKTNEIAIKRGEMIDSYMDIEKIHLFDKEVKERIL